MGFCRAEVKLLGPVQLYVIPVPDEVPVSVAMLSLQVRRLLLLAVVVRPVLFRITLAVSAELQPVERLVTVRVYTPAAPTVGF